MPELRLCPSCARRVYLTEDSCPFCEAKLEAVPEQAFAAVAAREWMGRAQFLAVAAAVTTQVLSGCGDGHKQPSGTSGVGGMHGGSGGQTSNGGSGGCGVGGCGVGGGGVGGGGVGGGGYGGFGGVYGGAPGPYYGGIGGNDTGGSGGTAQDDAGTIDGGDKDAAR